MNLEHEASLMIVKYQIKELSRDELERVTLLIFQERCMLREMLSNALKSGLS